jgi:glutaminyl-tRNA synthetase
MSSRENLVSSTNFIENIINDDLASGKHSRVITRFPPEPNGYLHIGHAKSICLNFSLAKEYQNSECYLRFDDTNPEKESNEYMRSIMEDVRWLGFDWGDNLFFASDYFATLYDLAVKLIEKGLAYVCMLTAEQAKEYRGTLTEPGKNSPYRNRPIAESLKLFAEMRSGQYPDGAMVLRAKIDMAAGNINMRDPILFRIRHVHHHRQGDKWCIYPMYDFTHPISDSLEGITHSLCTLEFQDHRPLYEWFIAHCDMKNKPQQIEFSRLNFTHTITSKRKLKLLVDEGVVDGWDDPRMSTICGVRRRGFPAAAIRNFCSELGISKQESRIEFSQLENAVRDYLNEHAERRIAILNPIEVIIDNFNNDLVREITQANHPQDASVGARVLHFNKHIYIDASDFQEEPEKKFFRLAPGMSVRLSHACVITCNKVIKDSAGNVVCLHVTCDPETFGGIKPSDGIKVKGIIHWLAKEDAVPAEIRIYDTLFNIENPGKSENILDVVNHNSLQICYNAFVEPALLVAPVESVYQFVRTGYFCADKYAHKSGEKAVFNQTVALRESWKD